MWYVVKHIPSLKIRIMKMMLSSIVIPVAATIAELTSNEQNEVFNAIENLENTSGKKGSYRKCMPSPNALSLRIGRNAFISWWSPAKPYIKRGSFDIFV